MQEFHGLRPEDFQKAWPAAYAQAVAHVMALQQQAAHQLESATEQVLLAQRAAARSARLLAESKHDILDDIRAAHTDAQGQMHELSSVLEHAIKDLITREASFQQAVIREKINIDRFRAEATKAKSVLRNSPLWRRLLWALNPSEPC
jgi:hypothetical protein